MTGRKATILIVDDDPALRDELAEQLGQQDEFRVAQAANAAEGVSAASEGRASLILLDVNLPDMDGRDALKLMRAGGVRAPIVLLTAADTERDAMHGFDSGANDYVTKPFKFSLLLARIRAHLRTFEQSEDAAFQIGPYEFRPAQKLLVDAKNKRIRLTEKETSILRYLYRSGTQPVGREELLREVWGYNANVTTHTLETHVYRLRQKIEPDAQSPRLLLTEAGGYRLQL
ncbi:MAG: response regulator transcription factor [Hyphomonadaceae bacterium]